MKKITIALLAVTMLTACKSTSNVQVAHDTVYVTNTVTDVLVKYDSVYIDKWHSVIVEGDTVHLVDSVLVYKYRLVHDTLVTTDTVYKHNTSTSTTVVEKRKARWWVLLVAALLGAITYAFVSLRFSKV